ncbi:hypothetical protein NLI96_g4775 [Meripilus lineatus]|uniref:Uncharacterized protein n=1 Tax=Meripilus lineatus TaxID=2056292 RepID=A0AAD5V925_9APHY|nr:hypothetical protein NLI96_g4775 [Physisporinus lineatus]
MEPDTTHHRFLCPLVSRGSFTVLSDFEVIINLRGRFPMGLAVDEFPAQVSVAIPQEFFPYIETIMTAVPRRGDRDDGGSDSEPDIAVHRELMSPEFYTFLPLPSRFGFTRQEPWQDLAEGISSWLTQVVVHRFSPFWKYGAELFWMAYVAAHPFFPGRPGAGVPSWPEWDARILFQGDFVDEWLLRLEDTGVHECEGSTCRSCQVLRRYIWGRFVAFVQNVYQEPIEEVGSEGLTDAN